MTAWHLDQPVVERFRRKAGAERWGVSQDAFAAALARSAQKAFAHPPASSELERHLSSLHLEDVALACACASGHEPAWEYFVREHRPALYRAADALDPSGGARDLADSLYAELFGLTEKDGRRRSLFEYFHGRSSLSTWLRAILAQRHIDRIRRAQRLEPLPEHGEVEHTEGTPHPQTHAYIEIMRQAISTAVSRLDPRDRMRLAWYYAHDLTLAQIGQALREHEATVSRNLARARRDVRADVERQLREERRMSPAEVEECFATVVADVGTLDMADLLGVDETPATSDAPNASRKKGRAKRSKERAEGASA